MLIDSHAHLTSAEVLERAPSMLERAKAAGVSKIVNICTTPKELEEGIKLKERYPWVYNAAATPPHDVEVEGEDSFAFFRDAAHAKQLIALGETGLDDRLEPLHKEVQQKFLKRYLALSLECGLPVIFHCREAFSDLFAIADSAYQSPLAIIHCFTGTLEEAKEAISRGWYLSLSGILTFKKSEELRAIAKEIPIERLLIETDTPYLAPQGHRGKPNEPSFMKETAEVLAALKGLTMEEVGAMTSANAGKIFSF